MKWIKPLRFLIIIIGGGMGIFLGAALLTYQPEYIYRTLVWQQSDAFDWQKFPSHPLIASTAPYHFEKALDSEVAKVFEQISKTPDWNEYLRAN